MATFLPGISERLSPIPLYQPDYQFLSKVYSTRQNEYDKGFNMVKSLETSALNSQLSNPENQQYRSEVFKKIQDALKSVSGVDLSDPVNVLKAQALLNPIVKDKELARDMSLTQYQQQQRSELEAARTSTDSKVRSTYSDYNKIAMDMVDEQLRTSKRGDGSILSIQPQDFVPFQDITDYLNKAAKEQKLEVKADMRNGDGYIYSYKNGKLAYKPFTQWAQSQMGDKFDEQFKLIAKVQSEGAIRTKMSQGLSRQQAEESVKTDIAPQLMKDAQMTGIHAQAQLKDIDNQLAIYDREFGNNVPDKYKEKYDKLKQSKEDFTSILENAQYQLKQPIGNLQDVFMSEAKNRTSVGWAISTANATGEVTSKPDEVLLKRWSLATEQGIATQNINSRERIAGAEIASREKIAGAKLQFEAQKEDLKNNGDVTKIGTYTSTETMPAVDVLNSSYSDNKTKLFYQAFGAQTGLINLVVPPKDQGNIYGVLEKLKGISDGNGQILTPDEIKTLGDYGTKTNSLVYNPVDSKGVADPSLAAKTLNNLSAGTYTTASNNLRTHTNIDNTHKYEDVIKTFTPMLASMKTVLDQKENIDKSYKTIAGIVLENGKVKPEFDGAKIVGYTNDNQPIVDVSGLSPDKRIILNQAVGSEFSSRTNVSGGVYQFDKLTEPELFAITNDNFGINVKSDGDQVSLKQLEDLSSADKAKLFSNSVIAGYDPTTKNVNLKVTLSPESGIGTKLKIKQPQTITMSIPYATIKSNTALNRFSELVDKNTVNSESLGIFDEFATNPYTTVKSTGPMSNTDFNFTATGRHDGNGRYGIEITAEIKDPKDGSMHDNTVFVPNIDPTNPESLVKVNNKVNEMWLLYRNAQYLQQTQNK